MRVQIATRGCEIPEKVRKRAEEQIARLSRYEPGLSGADVVFEVEGHRRRAEAVLGVSRGEPVVARGEGDDFRSALDQMLDRLARILRERRARITDHQGPALSEVVVEGEEERTEP